GALALTATATQAGTMSVSTHAGGTNQFSARMLQSATATTGQVLVQRAAALTATVSVTPGAKVSVGQSLTVTMQVQNTGEAAAVNVTPSVLAQTGTGMAMLASGPTPPSA